MTIGRGKMGELSKSDAEVKRSKYISILTKQKEYVREDFEEMDFENAVQRDIMEGYIEEIEKEFGILLTTLQNMQFS